MKILERCCAMHLYNVILIIAALLGIQVLVRLSKVNYKSCKNKMIRFILNLENRSHVGLLEQEKVNMLPVSSRVQQLKLNHVLNIRNDNCPEYLKENFSKISDTELKQCTRASRFNFFLPRVLNQAVNTFYFSGIKDWNALPAKIKEITNADSFRSAVKEHILTELKNKAICPFVYNSGK